MTHEQAVQYTSDVLRMWEAAYGVQLNDLDMTLLGARAFKELHEARTLTIQRVNEFAKELNLLPNIASASLPHEDIAELRDIRNLADVKRVMALPKEKMAKYMRLRPASPAFHEFNQRVQYIQQHRIMGNPSVAEPQQPPKPATPQAAKLAEIRGRVDSLKGYTNSVISFRNRVHAEIREMIADRQSLEQIEKHVVARIRNYENGSIR